jgi:hypothetical protein
MSSTGDRKSEWLRFGVLHCLASFTAVCVMFVLFYQLLAAGSYAGVLVSLLSDKLTMRLLAVPLWLYALPGGMLYLLSKRDAAFPKLFFFGFYLAYAALLCVFYLHNVDPQYVSDFQRMWDAATQMASQGPHPVRNIIEQRAVFILYPVLRLFGQTHEALQFANSAFYVGVGLIAYDAVRRQAGHRSAQALCLVWLVSFEPLMAIGIPTHDLWGIVFTAAALWLLVRGQVVIAAGDAFWKAAAWLVATGVFLALLQAQREIGVVLLLAACIVLGYTELSARRAAWRTVLVPVIVLIAFGISSMGLRQIGLVAPKEGQQRLETSRIAGFATSFSTGRFAYGIAVRDTFLQPLDPDAGTALSHSIFLSDTASQPGDRFPNIIKRLTFLAVPGFQTYFYMAGVPKVRLVEARAVSALSAFLVFGLGAWATITLLRRPRRQMLPVTAVVLIFAGIMLLAFCTLSEVQPRYAFFMWLVTGVLIADGLFTARRVDEATPTPAEHIVLPEPPTRVRTSLGPFQWQFLTVIGLALLGWLALDLVYSADRGRILSEWHYSVEQQAQPAGKTDTLAGIQEEPTSAFSYLKLPADQISSFGDLGLTLEFPVTLSHGDTLAAERMVCASGARSLEFYVSTPYKNLQRTGAFDLTLTQGGNVLWSTNLPAADHPFLVRVPVGEGCSRFVFRLTSNVAMPSESWRRASRVEIIFPRLVDRN